MKKIVDVVCFVLVPGIAIVSIFSFGNKWLGGESHSIYYPLAAKVGVGVGVALICIGILIKRWGKNEVEKKTPERE